MRDVALLFYIWLGVMWGPTAGKAKLHTGRGLRGEASLVTLLSWPAKMFRGFLKNEANPSSVIFGYPPPAVFIFKGEILVLAVFLLSLFVQVSAAQYSYTGGAQTIVVPAGAITMGATLYGGAGGTKGSLGGYGGMIAANIPVSSGQTYYLRVGEAASSSNAGWNGGGAGSSDARSTSAGGGGATDLRTSGDTLNDRILVAGGGGGATSNCAQSGYPGGGGGYPSGLSGPQCSRPTGVPGTATAGGVINDPPYCTAANNGGFGVGGNACLNGGVSYGGAGGGGWYGGSGSYYSPGAGGSSYSAHGVTSFTNAVNAGNGFAIIGFLYPQPTTEPTCSPTPTPTNPTCGPTRAPSFLPTSRPSGSPTSQPSKKPSHQPSGQPSASPTAQPSGHPTQIPTGQPSCQPSAQPLGRPSAQPRIKPSSVPTTQPASIRPSAHPTSTPSGQPTCQPSQQPSSHPSTLPTSQPSVLPSFQPTSQPSGIPSGQPSVKPSSIPTGQPSAQPSHQPSTQPSLCPTAQPTGQPSIQPTLQPSMQPTLQPTNQRSVQPSGKPSAQPSSQPTSQPSSQPTEQPTKQPSVQPSAKPSAQPSSQPSAVPSAQPSSQLSGEPTSQPSMQPSAFPSALPSGQPTGQPTGHPSVASVGLWVAAVENSQNISILTVVDDHIWACGGKAEGAFCTVVNILTGVPLTTYSFSWYDITTVVPIQNSHRVIVSGISINARNEASSEVADCVLDTGLRCTIQAIADTSFSAGMYVHFPDVFVCMGAMQAQTLVSIIDATTNNQMRSYVYTSPLMAVVTLSHLQSLSKYVGGLVAGTGVTSFGARNCIIAGMMRADQGQMTAIYLTPMVGYILNTVNLVNTLVAEFLHPDSFIAGGLQMSSVEGMHAYLVRVNVLYRTVLYGMRYVQRSEIGANRRLQGSVGSDSLVQKIILVENILYMIVNMPSPELFVPINEGSASVLMADVISGNVIRQANIYSMNASIQCSDMVSAGDYFVFACSARYAGNTTQAHVISVDRDLTFKKLHVGFSTDNLKSFTAEPVAFHRTALPLTATSDDKVTYSYQLNTTVVASTPLASVMPSIDPSIVPSDQPSSSPSCTPSSSPTTAPSVSPQPTSQPSSSGPTNTYKPTIKPTQRPSTAPSMVPTPVPSVSPTAIPTARPTEQPSIKPTLKHSVVLTQPPSLAQTAKVTKVKSVAPTMLPTFTPTSISSTALIVTVSGNTDEDTKNILLILVYIVAGLVTLWCLHRLRQYYAQLRDHRDKEEKVKKYFETVQRKASVHGTRFDAPFECNQKDPFSSTDQASHCSVLSEESSSLIISSLHSSEISDGGSSVDLEDSWYEGTHRSQSSPSTFEALSMEEGRANNAECESMYNGSSNSSGSSNQFESRSGSQSLVNSCDT